MPWPLPLAALSQLLTQTLPEPQLRPQLPIAAPHDTQLQVLLVSSYESLWLKDSRAVWSQSKTHKTSPFHVALIHSAPQQRRLAESARFQSLSDSLVKLEKSLEAEVKRRAEADRQIQVMAGAAWGSMGVARRRPAGGGATAVVLVAAAATAPLYQPLQRQRRQQQTLVCVNNWQ